MIGSSLVVVDPAIAGNHSRRGAGAAAKGATPPVRLAAGVPPGGARSHPGDEEEYGPDEVLVPAGDDDCGGALRIVPCPPLLLRNQRDRPCILDSAAPAAPPDDAGESGAPLLVHGPPGSGRTSLLMDLAIRRAARAPCRCGRGNDDDNDLDDSADSAACRCTAVLLFRVADSSADSADGYRFPLPCHCLQGESTEGRNVQRHSSSSNKNGKAETDTSPLLRRIRVHHLADIRDAYATLLAVQGLPVEEQPWGGILVDDLDKLVHRRGHQGFTVSQPEAAAVPFASPPPHATVAPPRTAAAPVSPATTQLNYSRISQFCTSLKSHGVLCRGI